MIKPTVGRNVHYYPAAHDPMVRYSDQPCHANIAHVWSDTCVNLIVADHDGTPFSRTSVPINIDVPEGYARAEWMAYQQGQAAKTEATEAKLAAVTAPPPAPEPVEHGTPAISTTGGDVETHPHEAEGVVGEVKDGETNADPSATPKADEAPADEAANG